ncbi:MAG: hypothetical protein AB8C13_05770 [Phycisphaerales bacterium]
MRLPWWPIYIDAELEDEGVRVIGEQGGELLPAGTLVRWDRVGFIQLVNPVEEYGKCMRIGPARLSFKLAPKTATEKRSSIRELRLLQRRWYQDPSHRFEHQTDPKDKRRAILSVLGFSSYFSCCFLLIPFWMMYNQFDPADGTVMTGDLRRVYLILNSMAILAGIIALLTMLNAVYQVSRAKKSWWITKVDQDGADLERHGATLRILWSQLFDDGEYVRMNRLRLSTESSTDKMKVYWFGLSHVAAVLNSKVEPQRPKLFTFGFVVIGLISLFSGTVVNRVFDWLDVEFMEGGGILLTVSCLMLCALLIYQHTLALKAWKESVKDSPAFSQ